MYANLKYANKLTDSVTDVTLGSGTCIYFKRIRIVALSLANYFESVSEFDYLNQTSDLKSIEDDMDEDNESATDEPSDLMESELEKDSDCTIVKSPPYYWSIFEELTLCLFRSHALELILHAYNVGRYKYFLQLSFEL